MRSIALSWPMMLSGIQDGEGSGTGDSLAGAGGSLGCQLARKEVHVERVMYLSSRNSNILLRSCPNGDRIWIGDVGDDRCCQC